MENRLAEDNLFKVLIDYMEARNAIASFSQELFENRLANLGKSVEQIQELLIELNHEWEQEQLSIVQLKKSRKTLNLGIPVVVLIAVSAFVSARYTFFKGNLQFAFFLMMGSVLLITLDANRGIKKETKRKERRFIKWKNWV